MTSLQIYIGAKLNKPDTYPEAIELLREAKDQLRHVRCIDEDASKCQGCSIESRIDTFLSRLPERDKGAG